MQSQKFFPKLLITVGGLLAVLSGLTIMTAPANAVCADGLIDCAAGEPSWDTTRAGDFNAREDEDAKDATVRSRLLDIAKRQQIPDATMADLLRVFAYEFDLDRPVRSGDALKVLYGADAGAANALLAAELDFAGQSHTLYRFATDGGAADYYDAAGRSWRTRLERKPLAAGDLRSGFGMHRHPILGTSRMHTGVDWVAPTGTPVYAAGDGHVLWASSSVAMGKEIRFANADGFETGYAHLQKITPGLRPGVRVRQGQVIGAVGSTGVSSGPHLHYEILRDGRYVDPLRIELEPAHELGGAELTAFTGERDRLDQQLRQAPAHELAAPGAPL